MKDITKILIELLENDNFCKTLLEKSIEKAYLINGDTKHNKTSNLQEYINYIDDCVHMYPWEIYDCPIGLYDRLDQGMGHLYFINNQPLDELKDYNFYYNSLMYYKPYHEWFTLFLKENERFLDSADSWNKNCLKFAMQNNDFNLLDGTYEEPSNWKCFNDFFNRKLKNKNIRSIIRDENIVIAPADSQPFGVWNIDENGFISTKDCEGIYEKFNIKTRLFRSIVEILDGSVYANSFFGGKITHAMLGVKDYHRYHFPFSGTVIEKRLIPGVPAPGGVIYWNDEKEIYEEVFMNQLSWQAIETRGLIIIQTEKFGKVAILPVGMCQVSSVKFNDNFEIGSKVQKGDEFGYFKFGGSDIIMVFEKESGFEFTAQKDKHILMGEEYGEFAIHL